MSNSKNTALADFNVFMNSVRERTERMNVVPNENERNYQRKRRQQPGRGLAAED